MLVISEQLPLMGRDFRCTPRLVNVASAVPVSQGHLAHVFSRLEGPDNHYCDAAWAAQPHDHA